MVAHLKGGGPPEYLDEITEGPPLGLPGMPGESPSAGDAEGKMMLFMIRQ